MIIYGHFLDSNMFSTLGISGTFWNPDNNLTPAAFEPFQKHCLSNLDFRYVLGFWFTEERLTNQNNIWKRDVTNALNWLAQQSILAQCNLIQYDDEWWTALWGNRFTESQESQHWPSLRRLTQAERWGQRYVLAEYFARRTDELRDIWQEIAGTKLPPVGMSETGSVAPPEFRGQQYWILDIYLAPQYGDQYSTSRAVRAKYDQAWKYSNLDIMPVIPLFADSDDPRVPTLEQLSRCYLPIIFHPRTFSVALFPFTPHNTLAEVGLSYCDGVRWLTKAV